MESFDVKNASGSKGSGISLVIQNHMGNINAEESFRLVKMVGRDDFGVVFSPDHCVLGNEDIPKLLDENLSYIKQIYIADLKVNHEDSQKPNSVYPGKGDVPLEFTMKQMISKGYAGWLTFKYEKIWVPELDEAEKSLPYFINYINNFNMNFNNSTVFNRI